MSVALSCVILQLDYPYERVALRLLGHDAQAHRRAGVPARLCAVIPGSDKEAEGILRSTFDNDVPEKVGYPHWAAFSERLGYVGTHKCLEVVDRQMNAPIVY